MDKRPIGVFDSGLGGLTAVRELRRILPGEDIVYSGTPAGFPTAPAGGTPFCSMPARMCGFCWPRM